MTLLHSVRKENKMEEFLSVSARNVFARANMKCFSKGKIYTEETV